MKSKREIKGVLPVLHLSYGADGQIHATDLEREIEWVLENDADGCCLGMVTDLFRLTFPERVALTETVVRHVNGRGVVIASVGGESCAQAVLHARNAREAGADAVMAIPPLVSALSDAEAERYFRSLAEAVDLPLVIQDASGYVGRPLSLAMQLRLFREYGADKILFKPETSPIGPTVSRLRKETGGKARVFEGSGGLHLIETFRRGLAGAMPGCDLIDGIVALWRALQAGDDSRAYRIYLPIAGLVTLQVQGGLDGFMSIERYILKKRGVFTETSPRPPTSFVPDEVHCAEVDRLLALMDVAIGGE
jgi:4-hydroxy-tetrahydrodipicolinate synthase